MKKLFNREKKNNKGFTLVELVVVVAILAILVGLLAPQYTKYVEKSRKSADISNLENIVRALEVAASDTDYDVAGKGTTDATYDISITANGTKIDANDTNEGDWTSALEEATGLNFSDNNTNEEIKLKSSKWSATGNIVTNINANDVAIGAKVTIKSDGAVTVIYDPATIKDTGNQK